MRHIYIVTYDVCDPKRLRKVFKLMRGYGDHLQLSVFRCELNAIEVVELRGKLGELIHHGEDQVLFVKIGLAEGRAADAFETIGVPYVVEDQVALAL
jgi:CRISPR-associated protein Cas2